MLQSSLCLEHTQTSLKLRTMSNRPWIHGKRMPALKHVLDTDLKTKGKYSIAFLMFTCSFTTCHLAMQIQRVGRERCLREGCVLCQAPFFFRASERTLNTCWAPSFHLCSALWSLPVWGGQLFLKYLFVLLTESSLGLSSQIWWTQAVL